MSEENSQKIKKPWPTKKAMEQIYDRNLWGNNDAEFYSGFGSHSPELVNPYIEKVQSFLTSFDEFLTVCDLGCGDFNIGNQLVKYTQKYIAVDIVPELIKYNKSKFMADNLEFKCLDVSKDNLPKVDCVIIRQVLQHLSNAEVQRILHKLVNFKYIIITEHIPKGDFIANKDIISGQGIRLKKNSGLDILKHPFCFEVKDKKQLLCVDLENEKGVVVSWLLEVF
ncbi:class I SAM-dependent methyltransferase [Polaribacter litorisediminis]|uniref:class I SAM-dependent methyltransferase n=1 Tax=Polaribacter litorisediminis TaxID=1908341 RepID=UPI001CBFA506|nr:class I SAM-dependent methyltransferase [Polaribacter litorisediminis]UAM98530.1 class I SAM-dependent methyltransferase [Polaribacter litorisediminis]